MLLGIYNVQNRFHFNLASINVNILFLFKQNFTYIIYSRS